MKIFGQKPHLWMRAEARWRGRCPCCGVRMVAGRLRAGQRMPRDYRTAGHDKPVSLGGRRWVYICHGCNGDQGSLTYKAWAYALVGMDDRRAPAVIALVRWLMEEQDDGHVETSRGAVRHAGGDRDGVLPAALGS